MPLIVRLLPPACVPPSPHATTIRSSPDKIAASVAWTGREAPIIEVVLVDVRGGGGHPPPRVSRTAPSRCRTRRLRAVRRSGHSGSRVSPAVPEPAPGVLHEASPSQDEKSEDERLRAV